MIWLLERLRVNPLENLEVYAKTYEILGYVDTKKEADILVKMSGVYVGTGWPIEKGIEIPNLRTQPIKHFGA